MLKDFFRLPKDWFCPFENIIFRFKDGIFNLKCVTFNLKSVTFNLKCVTFNLKCVIFKLESVIFKFEKGVFKLENVILKPTNSLCKPIGTIVICRLSVSINLLCIVCGFKFHILNYARKLSQESYIILKIDPQIIYLIFQHRYSLHSHSKCKACIY